MKRKIPHDRPKFRYETNENTVKGAYIVYGRSMSSKEHKSESDYKDQNKNGQYSTTTITIRLGLLACTSSAKGYSGTVFPNVTP